MAGGEAGMVCEHGGGMHRDSPGSWTGKGTWECCTAAPSSRELGWDEFRGAEDQERLWEQWVKLFPEQSWAFPDGEVLHLSRAEVGQMWRKKKVIFGLHHQQNR